MKSLNQNPLTALLLALTLLAGCSSSGNYYLAPDYEDNKVDEQVLILPVDQQLFSPHFQHPFGYLSTSQWDAFRDALESGYSRAAGVRAVTFNGDRIEASDFKVTILDVGGTTIQVITPSEGASLGADGTDPAFVLVLDQFMYRKSAKAAGSSGYAGHEDEIDYSLHFETKYVYWDTRTGTPVGWGIASTEKELDGEDATGDDYSQLVSEALDNIARNGPVRGNPRQP